MSQAVVVEIENFTNGVVKEIGLYRNGICIGLAFKQPYPFSTIKSWDRKRCKYLTEKRHNLEWNCGTVPYNYLPHVLDLICEYRSYEVQNFSTAAWVMFMNNILDASKTKRSEYVFHKSQMEFFKNGIDNCTLLETIFNRHFYDLNSNNCPEATDIATEISKQSNFIGECSSYPREHADIVDHCAQRRAHLYGLWLQHQFEKGNSICKLN